MEEFSGNMENIVINVDFQKKGLPWICDTAVQVVPADIAWEDLELMLMVYADQKDVKVFYSDEDNDLIIIESQEELQESFKVAQKCNNTLKFVVVCDGQPCPPDQFDSDRDQMAAHFLDDFVRENPFRTSTSAEPWFLAGGFEKGSGTEAGETRQTGDGKEKGKESREDAKTRSDINSDKQDSSGGRECDDQKVTDGDRHHFFVVNTKWPNLVLDIEGGNSSPGAQVIVWRKKSPRHGILNQLWYRDEKTATIRSALNDFCLDVVDGRLVVNPCDLNKISQKWTISGSKIKNVFSANWVVGLKTAVAQECDKVFGASEDELTNAEWTFQEFNLSQIEAEVVEFVEQLPCQWSFPECVTCPMFPLMPADGKQAGGCRRVVVVCDNCNQIITGVRYKCGFCPDFDLCANCEATEGVHDPNHLLLKMRVPQEIVQMRFSTVEPLLMQSVFGYAPGAHSGMSTVCKNVLKLQKKEAKLVQKARKREEKMLKCEEKMLRRAMKYEEKMLQRTEKTEKREEKFLRSAEKNREKGRQKEKNKRSMHLAVSKELDDLKNEKNTDEVLLEDARRSGELSMAEGFSCAETESNSNTSTNSLTVPSNTPLVDSPPRTPSIMVEPDSDAASQSGATSADAMSTDGKVDMFNMAVMADLVHEKMSDLAMKADYEYVDLDGDSDSSDYSDDYYIVPIPDCFNPDLPPRKEASTTVVVKKSGVRSSSLKSVDDMLRTSSCFVTQPLLSPTCFSTGATPRQSCGVPQMTERFEADGFIKKGSEFQELEDGELVPLVPPLNRAGVNDGLMQPDSAGVNIKRQNSDDHKEEEQELENTCAAVPGENADSEVDVNQNETDRSEQQDGSGGGQTATDDEHDESDVENQNENNSHEATAETTTVSGVEASTLKLMSSVFSFVAKTAKDVFNTLQDKNSYTPQRSDWTPSQNVWTPPENNWTPPQQPHWSPPQPQWTPPATEGWQPPASHGSDECDSAEDQRSPMDQLIDMGFADRELNRQLLQSCGNNVATVVQKLVEMNDNNIR